MARRVNVDINVINEIINDCLKWGIFDKSIYEKHKVLTSRGIQRRYLKAADRRQRVQINSIHLLLDDEEVNAYKNLIIVNNNHHSSNDNANINPQSKEKKSKEENSREENTLTTSTDADNGPEQKEVQSGKGLTVKRARTVAGKETCEQPSKTLIEKRFDEFWAAYPKKVGKKAAWAAWNKIKPDAELHNKILTAIGKAKLTDQWQRENGRYIPNPKTWLNEGRWDDEYEDGSTNGINSKHFDGHNQQPAPSSPGSESKRDALRNFKRAEDIDFYSRSINKGK